MVNPWLRKLATLRIIEWYIWDVFLIVPCMLVVSSLWSLPSDVLSCRFVEPSFRPNVYSFTSFRRNWSRLMKFIVFVLVVDIRVVREIISNFLFGLIEVRTCFPGRESIRLSTSLPLHDLTALFWSFCCNWRCSSLINRAHIVLTKLWKPFHLCFVIYLYISSWTSCTTITFANFPKLLVFEVTRRIILYIMSSFSTDGLSSSCLIFDFEGLLMLNS